MTEAEKYEAKFEEMQKYIPFLQKVIEKLKVTNNDQPTAENPRKAQLQKMEMLYELLTNRNKKLKIETLLKCEGVLIKLHAKIEKQSPAVSQINADKNILQNVKLKTNTSAPAEAKQQIKEPEILEAPASPPPEKLDDIERPIEIPTERRCSPILIKDSHHHNHHSKMHKRTQDKCSAASPASSPSSTSYSKDNSHAQDKDFRQKTKDNSTEQKDAREQRSTKEHHSSHRHRHHSHSSSSSHSQQHQERSSSHDRNHSTKKSKDSKSSRDTESKLKQTVKVVIPEKLPADFAKQHFASYKYSQKQQQQQQQQRFNPASTSTNLIDVLNCSRNSPIPTTPAQREAEPAYNPEESWEEYNVRKNKPVFARLGEKVSNDKSDDTKKTVKTPLINDLTSPPLSATDITNLIIETGGDVCQLKTAATTANTALNDISEIGTRRPKSAAAERITEEPIPTLLSPSSSSLDFVRRKFAQIAKISSPNLNSPSPPSLMHNNTSPSSIDAAFLIKNSSSSSIQPLTSPLANERVALKYNPHPRQEKDCNIKDPRLKTSPCHLTNTVPASCIGLPSINLNDPRIKKQNITPQRPVQRMEQTPSPQQSAATRNDPRLARPQPMVKTALLPTPNIVRNPINQQGNCSSEENWDSEPEEESFTKITKPNISQNQQPPMPPPLMARRMSMCHSTSIEDKSATYGMQQTSPQIIGFGSLNVNRNDPRLSRQISQTDLPSNPFKIAAVISPNVAMHNVAKPKVEKRKKAKHKVVKQNVAKPNVETQNYSSEENWDSEPEEDSGKIKPIILSPLSAQAAAPASLPAPLPVPAPVPTPVQAPIMARRMSVGHSLSDNWHSNAEQPQQQQIFTRITTQNGVQEIPPYHRRMSISQPRSIFESEFNKIKMMQPNNRGFDSGIGTVHLPAPIMPSRRMSIGHALENSGSQQFRTSDQFPTNPVSDDCYTSVNQNFANHNFSANNISPNMSAVGIGFMPNSGYMQNSRFNALQNDNSEKSKYFEAKRQHQHYPAPTQIPRTYREHKLAMEKEERERAAAAAAKYQQQQKIADEATKPKEDLKSVPKEKSQIKEEAKTKVNPADNKKKLPAQSSSTAAAGESALDKMYRTQNFNTTTFPKTTISFKIPKKKTVTAVPVDEMLNEKKDKNAAESKEMQQDTKAQKANVVIKETEMPKEKETLTKQKEDKIAKEKCTEAAKDKPTTAQQKLQQTTKANDDNKNLEKELTPKAKYLEKCKELLKAKELALKAATTAKEQIEKNNQASKNKLEQKQGNEIATVKSDGKTQEQKEKQQQQASETSVATAKNKDNAEESLDKANKEKAKPAVDSTEIAANMPNCKIKLTRDPRIKALNNVVDVMLNKGNLTATKGEPKETDKDKDEIEEPAAAEPLKCSSPQKNLQEFLNLKPQRILRRRCTMVAFGSAPLVDKEKILSANALLFEDVQEHEKRKLKAINGGDDDDDDDERHNARRHRNLQNIFEKTDDNCTVSTQNIIMGKRRTRATINFNETENARNIFKHIKPRKENKEDVAATNAAKPSALSKAKMSKAKKIEMDIEDPEVTVHQIEAVGQSKKKIAADLEESVAVEEIKEVKLPKKAAGAAGKVLAKKEAAEEEFKNETEMNTSEITTTTTEAALAKETEEFQNCAVSSTSAEVTSSEMSRISTATAACSVNNDNVEQHDDENEPTSSGGVLKSHACTPTPSDAADCNTAGDETQRKTCINDFVQEIAKPNVNKQHILSLLGQLLEGDKLDLLKTALETNNIEGNEQEQQLMAGSSIKSEKLTNDAVRQEADDEEEEEFVEEEKAEKKPKAQNKKKPVAAATAASAKSTAKKKPAAFRKRNELDRLNEDIREMFICEGVLTATGKRMCTIMSQQSAENASPASTSKAAKSKTKQKAKTAPIRRSLRGCKTPTLSIETNNSMNNTDDELHIDDNDEDAGAITDDSTSTNQSRRRRTMPILKPNTPVKLPEELELEENAKVPDNELEEQAAEEKKNVAKKSQATKRNLNEQTTDELKTSAAKRRKTRSLTAAKTNSESELELEQQSAQEKTQQNLTTPTNTNVNWHYQSKYLHWCLICEKKVTASTGIGHHYKVHHDENYISRLPPNVLINLKKDTAAAAKPLFGVNHSPKANTWFHRCPFCMQYFNTTLNLWLEHMRDHTAEFKHQCSECNFSTNVYASGRRHMDKCKGGKLLNCQIKLENDASLLMAYVCHLCNFLQFKRQNLDKHYAQQHKLDELRIKDMGYAIRLIDLEQVQVVSEKELPEKEAEAWAKIYKQEQAIEILDNCSSSEAENDEENSMEQQQQEEQPNAENNQEPNADQHDNESLLTILKTAPQSAEKPKVKTRTTPQRRARAKVIEMQRATEVCVKKESEKANDDGTATEQADYAAATEQANNDTTTACDVSFNEQDIQDELLTLAEEAAADSSDLQHEAIQAELLTLAEQAEASVFNLSQELQFVDEPEAAQDELLMLAAQAEKEEEDEEENQNVSSPPKIGRLAQYYEGAMQALIMDDDSNSPDKPTTTTTTSAATSNYEKPSVEIHFPKSIEATKRKSAEEDKQSVAATNAKRACTAEASALSLSYKNAFLASTTQTQHSNANESPHTTQIIAQSIIRLDPSDGGYVKAAQAEVQGEAAAAAAPPTSSTLKDNTKTTTIAERISQRFKDLQQNDAAATTVIASNKQQQVEDSNKQLAATKPAASSSAKALQEVTLISDDEDWEDIEITESAPSTSQNVTASSAGGIQTSKSNKNRGLFQKFTMFGKGAANASKSRKYAQPVLVLPKKKGSNKDKLAAATSTATSSASSTPPPSSSASDVNAQLSANIASLGFKPVVNNLSDLLPDSPCNDPIDLVPELAPLEPLQDLNDISSILDSNLSHANAVSINLMDNQTSIEDALAFVSEQDKAQTSELQLSQKQLKIIINRIQHVGYSNVVSDAASCSFKFYCLLENCTFLYSNDAIGLENHYLCEHAQVKWNGFCQMCQTFVMANDAGNDEKFSIVQEIKHLLDKHALKSDQQEDINLEINSNSVASNSNDSNSTNNTSKERPKIKLRRLSGDCLSSMTDITAESSLCPNNVALKPQTTSSTDDCSFWKNLLNAKPRPPTKEMPPIPEMAISDSLLLNSSAFKNVGNDFVITSVSSAASPSLPTSPLSDRQTELPLQISSVVSLNNNNTTAASSSTVTNNQDNTELMPQISNVCSLNAGSLWSKQLETDRHELFEAATTSYEASKMLEANSRRTAGAGSLSANRTNDNCSPGPVVIAETVPLAQTTSGDFFITQTVSAQYDKEDTHARMAFNISISASALNGETGTAAGAATTSSPPPLQSISNIQQPAPVISRQFKCMSLGCKYITRVPVAMSDHLRFHEKRNFSNSQDYLNCAFCSHHAEDVEAYMKHAEDLHIFSGIKSSTTTSSTSTSLTTSMSAHGGSTSVSQKIQDLLNNRQNNAASSNNAASTSQSAAATVDNNSEDVYYKKLRDTIEEIIAPTGIPEHKLYRCVVKQCNVKLTEATFHTHIVYHIATLGYANPNTYIYKCPHSHCSAQYSQPAAIKTHIKNHAKRNCYFCYLCQETTANPLQMLKHYTDKHCHAVHVFCNELLKPVDAIEGSTVEIYYVSYTEHLTDQQIRDYGRNLILEWQRKKARSKTHFKSNEIELLPMQPIFQRDIFCGECAYKTKVRTNMFRHLLMHKQNYPGSSNYSGDVSQVASVDPVNPVPCLNSNERHFDKMTNLASSSLIPSMSGSAAGNNSSSSSASSTASSTTAYVLPYKYVEATERLKCGCPGCSFIAKSDNILRMHWTNVHSDVRQYSCPHCNELICKQRGISAERILYHFRFHDSLIYRCEECNRLHYMRLALERHVAEKHATLKVNVIIYERSKQSRHEGKVSKSTITGKKYQETGTIAASAKATSKPAKNTTNAFNSSQSSSAATSASSSLSSSQKSKNKWICDLCGLQTNTLAQILTHCQNQHGTRDQYQCMHCTFGSAQLSQILYHIDEAHDGKGREARRIYHVNEESVDTRPLWQRNDPTRVRHIRGILIQDEDETEMYAQDEDDGDDDAGDDEDDEQLSTNDNDNAEDDDADTQSRMNFIAQHELECYHCNFSSNSLLNLTKHFQTKHNIGTHKTFDGFHQKQPFWFRITKRLCCGECRKFIGNHKQLQLHLLNVHRTRQFFVMDIKMAENEDDSTRLMCAYCSFHSAKVELLRKHLRKEQHQPQDLRWNNDEIFESIVQMGSVISYYYQCTQCNEVLTSRDAVMQHSSSVHMGDDSIAYRDIKHTTVYHCAMCATMSTNELDILWHMIDHYGYFKKCYFCYKAVADFKSYMQHCYAEHRENIWKFKEIYTYAEIERFLQQMFVIFPNGLVINKKNIRHTSKFGNTKIIAELYAEMYRISQQPPIPRLSIASLVARKSIEAAAVEVQETCDKPQDPQVLLETSNKLHAKKIAKRRYTLLADDCLRTNSLSPQLFGDNVKEAVAAESANLEKNKPIVFNMPPQQGFLLARKISKRRCTVAVDNNDDVVAAAVTATSTSTTSGLLVVRRDLFAKKQKICHNLGIATAADIQPYSFYGQKINNSSRSEDLTKIHIKYSINGISTKLSINEFKQYQNIDCQLLLSKCDYQENIPPPKLTSTASFDYSLYKHVRKACPASHKMKYI